MLGHGSIVGAGKVLDFTLLAVLLRYKSLATRAHHLFTQHPQEKTPKTYLPLGETKFHLSTALSSNSSLVVEASADSAGRDGQVSVVAIHTKGVSRVPIGFEQKQNIDCLCEMLVGDSIDSRQTSGFPRSSHFGGD